MDNLLAEIKRFPAMPPSADEKTMRSLSRTITVVRIPEYGDIHDRHSFLCLPIHAG
jgi:hypothetical protein